MIIHHGSLFSGGGGFDLAADWCGWTNVFNCDKEPYCRSVLKQQFPKAQQYDNIFNFDATPFRGLIDVLTGGDPCQPSSVIGKKQGTADARYLWPQMLRITRECRPIVILNENVPGTISNGILDGKIRDLTAEGYTCWPPVIVPASAAGAAHNRQRIWLVAYAPARRLERRHDSSAQGQWQAAHRSVSPLVENRNWTAYAQSFIHGRIYGLPDRVDRTKIIGNAIVPHVAYEFFKVIQTHLLAA